MVVLIRHKSRPRSTFPAQCHYRNTKTKVTDMSINNTNRNYWQYNVSPITYKNALGTPSGYILESYLQEYMLQCLTDTPSNDYVTYVTRTLQRHLPWWHLQENVMLSWYTTPPHTHITSAAAARLLADLGWPEDLVRYIGPPACKHYYVQNRVREGSTVLWTENFHES